MTLFSQPTTKKRSKIEKKEITTEFLIDIEIACSRHFRYLRDNTPYDVTAPDGDAPFIELDSLWKCMEDTVHLIKTYKRDPALLELIYSTSLDFIKSLDNNTATLADMASYHKYFMKFYNTHISRVGGHRQAA